MPLSLPPIRPLAMTKGSIALFLLLGCFGSALAATDPAPLAFPTAEGYGKRTVGGRGGRVIAVTHLGDSGPGSLRSAVEASGPRTVVFRVSGTITLDRPLRIRQPFLTVAGQTAPGDGICIRRQPIVIEADEVILRHLRVRLGDESGADADAITARYVQNLMLDHLSVGWSIDETLSVYHCKNVTVQWCLVAESLYDSNHVKGQHGYGGIWGSDFGTYHHNLLAHHSSRNPRFASGCGHTDYRNNVVYNWGFQSCYGGENQQLNDPRFNVSQINMVANYYQPGPATKEGEVSFRIAGPSSRRGSGDYGKWYISGNVVAGNARVTADNWDGGVQPQGGPNILSGLKLDQPWAAMPIRQHTAEEAYSLVLERAGATLPRRDAIDTRIIREVREGRATYEGAAYVRDHPSNTRTGKSGIIDSQKDAGGWPDLRSLPAPADSDHDGMPDDWEKQHGLDPSDGNDGNRLAADGYTLLEKYLHSFDSQL
ncbi:MAG: hypothetical protein JNJ82_18380 [Opitutaceae bacterium]|nr:hypothetical protein [Opitutaceae bacterium]